MGNMVEDRIKNVMAAVFEIPADQITEDSSQDTIELWDSLKHMNLVVALEEEFGIELTDDEIIVMMNYLLIIEVLKNK
jgi:acyl carrier protein